jgi:hypothetical protein
MSRKLAWYLAALMVVAVLIGAGGAVASEVMDVNVLNWPDVQRVEGTVRVEGSMLHAREFAFKNVLVTPVRRTATNRFVEAGVVNAGGFGRLSVSVVGEVSGEPQQAGDLGVVLVPDTKRIMRAFQEDGRFLFPLEVTAPIRGGQQVYLAGGPGRFELAFPRYRVLLYNESDKAARVDLHLYASL